MLLPAVMTAGLGVLSYFIVNGKINENEMLIPALVFIAILFLGIILLGIYANKKCRK